MNNAGLRRVISDCEDMIAKDNNGEASESFAPNRRVQAHPLEAGFRDDFIQQSPFLESNNIINATGDAYDGTVSELTLSSQADPMDTIGAPITLIESHVGDNDQSLDNSSLSGDESDIMSGDRNNMLAKERNFVAFDNSGNRGSMFRDERDLLQRMDSTSSSVQSSSQRAPSSQTSDWGFFEDVHQSSDGKKGENVRNKKNARISSQARGNKDNGKLEIVFDS